MSSLNSMHYRRRRASSEQAAGLFPSPFPIHLVDPEGMLDPLEALRDNLPLVASVHHEPQVLHVELADPSGESEGHQQVLHLHYHYDPAVLPLAPNPPTHRPPRPHLQALHTMHLINNTIVTILVLLIIVMIFTTIVKVVPFFIKFGRHSKRVLEPHLPVYEEEWYRLLTDTPQSEMRMLSM